MEVKIILVEPKTEGNIGAVARVMKNFNLKKLVLVNPPEIGSEARRRAMHAIDVLESADILSSFESAIKDLDYVAGTSSVRNVSDKNFLRITIDVRDFVVRLKSFSGRLGILFGREDFGLLNKELEHCDCIITVPTAKKYPALNISHAAAIILYEIFMQNYKLRKIKKARNFERELLYRYFEKLLFEIDYPAQKRASTLIMYRRLLGRAVPTRWEFHSLMGVLSRTLKRLAEK